MDYMMKVEESMKVLDLLSTFLTKGNENYVVSDDIRKHIEDAFVKIRDIYEFLGEDPLLKEIIDDMDE